MKNFFICMAVAFAVLFAGCTLSTPGIPGVNDEPKLVGEWRIYSSFMYFDAGGAEGNLNSSVSSRLLKLNSDGGWEFGSSSGKWTVSEITEEDWQNWGVDAYGPARKITLNGWSGSKGDGPIEETEERIDFFWVIYRAEPPVVTRAGQVQTKFGHTVLK